MLLFLLLISSILKISSCLICKSPTDCVEGNYNENMRRLKIRMFNGEVYNYFVNVDLLEYLEVTYRLKLRDVNEITCTKNSKLYTLDSRISYILRESSDSVLDPCLMPFELDPYKFSLKNELLISICIDEIEYSPIYITANQILKSEEYYIPYVMRIKWQNDKGRIINNPIIGYKPIKRKDYTNITVLYNTTLPNYNLTKIEIKSIDTNDEWFGSYFKSLKLIWNLLKLSFSLSIPICSATSIVSCSKLFITFIISLSLIILEIIILIIIMCIRR